MKTRHDEMIDQFKTFHARHPEVWELFQRFAFEKIRQGFDTYSANGIFERIRWEVASPGYGENEFKINNNYRPFYARWFMLAHPKYSGFFRVREQTSRWSVATNLPELGPEDFN